MHFPPFWQIMINPRGIPFLHIPTITALHHVTFNTRIIRQLAMVIFSNRDFITSDTEPNSIYLGNQTPCLPVPPLDYESHVVRISATSDRQVIQFSRYTAQVSLVSLQGKIKNRHTP